MSLWTRIKAFFFPKQEPPMSGDDKLMVLRRVLDEVLCPALKIDPKKIYLFSKLSAPVGRHLHAWTYPADAFLEGPFGSASIAFRQESLQKMSLEHLIPILGHEACHALLDIDKIREGARIDESRAVKAAELLMLSNSDKIAALLKGVASGA